jgi:hypothetical protein
MTAEKAAPIDGTHVPINVHSEYEVAYWVKKLGVRRAELRDAIDQVGPMADDVERYLASRTKRACR